MFTYREFIDGSHEYRRRIKRERTDKIDREYAKKRYEAEVTMLELAVPDRPDILTEFYLESEEIFEYLKKTKDKKILDEDDCYILSRALTLSKFVDHAAGNVDGDLETFYKVEEEYLDNSMGGLIYALTSNQMPTVLAKVPVTEDDQEAMQTAFHEAFVGIYVFSALRFMTDCFPFSFAFWNCMNPFELAKKNFFLCDYEGTRPVHIYENVEIRRNLSLYQYMLLTNPSIKTTIGILLQIMAALQLAFDEFKFTHYDLHSKNILVEAADVSTRPDPDFPYAGSGVRVVIIDAGMSYCELNEKQITDFSEREKRKLKGVRLTKFGSTYNKLIGVSYDKPFPLGDCFRILFDIYSLANRDLQEALIPAIGFFFKNSDLGNRKFSHSFNGGSSGFLNKFTLTPFRDDLLTYTYLDFAKYLAKTYGWSEPERYGREDPLKLARHFKKSTSLPYGRLGVLIALNKDAAVGEIGLIEGSRQEYLDLFDKDLKYTVEMIVVFRRNVIPLLNKFVLNNLASISDRDFLGKYEWNSERFVFYARAFKELYSRIKLIERTDNFLGRRLQQQEEKREGISFGEFCRSLFPEPPLDPEEMLEVTRKIEFILVEFKDVVSSNSNPDINWIRSCLPAIKQSLKFFQYWKKEP